MAALALATHVLVEEEPKPHNIGMYSKDEERPEDEEPQLYAHVTLESPMKAEVREAVLYESPRLPELEDVLDEDLAAAADVDVVVELDFISVDMVVAAFDEDLADVKAVLEEVTAAAYGISLLLLIEILVLHVECMTAAA